ncbi:MAG: phosphoglycerate kinase [Candidatus Levybacteria bacterium]|nr:phosphoglycerate kinase [Candidatus Levybacteria bacterium]
MTFVDEVSIREKRILLRVDFNVSLTPNRAIADDMRIRQSLPTIQHLLRNGNRLILISHLDRPEGFDPKLSLQPVRDRLQQYLPQYPIHLVADFTKDKNLLTTQKPEDIVLLENIRFYAGEVQNDPNFAKQLAQLGDVYVNEAFSVSHRKEASIVTLPQLLPSYGGLLLKDEIMMLKKGLENPTRPLVAIVGGSKISTKIKFIDKLMDLADFLLIGGGLANNFLAAQGYAIGKSIVEQNERETTEALLKQQWTKRAKLLLPLDAVCGNPIDRATPGMPLALQDIPPEAMILDIGQNTQKLFANAIQQARTIIWNGPVGYIENPQYISGTDAIYEAVIANSEAISIVGGGDTLASLALKPDLHKISHISTGGGAMLSFVEEGTLPGIQALR